MNAGVTIGVGTRSGNKLDAVPAFIAGIQRDMAASTEPR